MYFIIREGEIYAGPFNTMAEAREVEGCENGDKIVSSDTGRCMFLVSTNGKWCRIRRLAYVSGALVSHMMWCVQKHTRETKSETQAPELRATEDAPGTDMVNAPPHYNQAGIECIDAIAAATSGKTGIEAVCVANVVKYLWRYELKNGVEDVKKARWYLDRLIGELEK